jgi:hypothetical protein
MAQPGDLAFHVLKLEQQLEAYQKLHAEEIGELRRMLDECKRALADLAHPPTNGADRWPAGRPTAESDRKEAPHSLKP